MTLRDATGKTLFISGAVFQALSIIALFVYGAFFMLTLDIFLEAGAFIVLFAIFTALGIQEFFKKNSDFLFFTLLAPVVLISLLACLIASPLIGLIIAAIPACALLIYGIAEAMTYIGHSLQKQETAAAAPLYETGFNNNASRREPSHAESEFGLPHFAPIPIFGSSQQQSVFYPMNNPNSF